MKKIWFVCLLVLGMCVACGGDDLGSDGDGAVTSDGSSETLVCGAAVCGGDPVGSWSLDSLCNAYSDVYPDPSCAGSQFAEQAFASGTFVLNEDNTYTRNLVSGVSLTINYPLSCGMSCESLEGGYDKDWPGIQCTQTDTECVCEGSVIEAVDTSGTYSVSGTTLSLQDTGATEGAAFEICVGNQTMIFDTTGNPAFDGILFVSQ